LAIGSARTISFFKIADALLVGDDRRHIGIGDAIQKLLDLSLDRKR